MDPKEPDLERDIDDIADEDLLPADQVPDIDDEDALLEEFGL
jgi:hypothetical protein